LCNVASCWKYIERNILTIHGPLNVKQFVSVMKFNPLVILRKILKFYCENSKQINVMYMEKYRVVTYYSRQCVYRYRYIE